MRIKHAVISLLLSAPLLIATNTVHASLIGDTVSCAVTGIFQPTCGLSDTAVVGAGPEFVFAEPNFAGDLLDVDLGAPAVDRRAATGAKGTDDSGR